MNALYTHVAHPHARTRAAAGPVRVADQHPAGNAVARLNTRVALLITRAVGSMWCAYLFAGMDLLSLKPAIDGGVQTIVSWIAQTFLQLVLLSIILVGQNVQAEAADKRAEATFADAEALLHGQEQLAAHMAAQDAVLRALAEHAGIDTAGPA